MLTRAKPTMQNLTITPPAENDAAPLLAFELANRAWFESWINARPASYYSLDAVKAAIDLAQREAQQERAYQFLIKVEGQIVGRVNLTQIAREYFNKAMLGYRIGQAFGGRGYASRAVALALDVAFDKLHLWRVEATVRPENLGSVRVLQRNGFTEFGRATECMKLNDIWSDLLYFECHANKRRAALIAPSAA
jgi:ribosomal-protein-alanine N-acetyltransferase